MLANVFAAIPFAAALVVLPVGTPTWLKSIVRICASLMIELVLFV